MLDLAMTPLSESQDYRKKIFEYLPSLQVIDGEDKEGNPVDETSDEESLDDDKIEDDESEEEFDDDEDDDEEDGEDDGEDDDD